MKSSPGQPSWASMRKLTGLLAIVEGIAIDVFFATHSVRLALVEREVERKHTSNTLWCAVGDHPNVCIQMSNAVAAVLPFGIIRRPSTLYFYVDTPSEFVELVGKRWSSP
jgi:hypothetical protein